VSIAPLSEPQADPGFLHRVVKAVAGADTILITGPAKMGVLTWRRGILRRLEDAVDSLRSQRRGWFLPRDHGRWYGYSTRDTSGLCTKRVSLLGPRQRILEIEFLMVT
jgi:hypothetical protein